MNIKEFNLIHKKVKEYMATLNLDEVKKEFVEKGLLTVNKKLQKGDLANFGLEMLPSVLSGKNLCPGAGKCKLTCLAFSGVGNILKGKKLLGGGDLTAPLKSKARKTFLYLNDYETFALMLKSEIQHKHLTSTIAGKKVYFRLNVTTDIDWTEITNELKNISFYDYTKLWNRKSTENYHLTFSASELTSEQMIENKVNQGENVAVVFNSNKLPNKFLNFEVIDGDIDDGRYNDPKGVIVGLVLKSIIGGKDANDFTFKAAA